MRSRSSEPKLPAWFDKPSGKLSLQNIQEAKLALEFEEKERARARMREDSPEKDQPKMPTPSEPKNASMQYGKPSNTHQDGGTRRTREKALHRRNLNIQVKLGAEANGSGGNAG